MDKRFKHIEEALLCCVEGQLGDLKSVDAKELGEVVDMIKDFEEAIYYCTITKAMNEPKDHMKHEMREEPKFNSGSGNYSNGGRSTGNGNSGAMNGRMYYGGSTGHSGYDPMYYDNNGEMETSTRNYDPMKRDPMEGRSPMYRKMYMESKKANGGDSAKNAKELEDYMHELTEDVMEMIEGASMEEKQMLRQKISLLANKIK